MSSNRTRENVLYRQAQMVRKRDERIAKNAYRRERAAKFISDDDSFAKFAHQLAVIGLCLRDIPGDGNCLFRSLADQYEGHHRHHMRHRLETADYIASHRKDFEPFIEEHFDRYVANLKKPGVYAGNDAIVAFARNHCLTVVIHQLSLPCWKIHGSDKVGIRELHISYHNGDHYSSVRRLGDVTEMPANIRLVAAEPARPKEKERHKRKPDKKEMETKLSKSRSLPSISAIASSSQTVIDGVDGEMPNGHTIYPDANGVAKAVRGVADIAQYVMQETDYEDQETIENILVDMEFDVDATISHVLQLKELTSSSSLTSPVSERGTISSPISAISETATDVTSLASYQTNDSGICGQDVCLNQNGFADMESTSRISSGYGSHSSRASAASSVRPKLLSRSKPTNKQRKEQAKHERKKRHDEQHKMKGKGVLPENDLVDESSQTVIVNEINMLKI